MLLSVAAWLYGAWLTWRHVDEHASFPAVVFPEGLVRLRVTKHPGACWIASGRLAVHPWLGRHAAVLQLDPGATFEIERDVAIGPGVRLYVAGGGHLVLGGREHESASGLTADSVVMAHRRVEIGADCIVGWHAFITDCDWHGHGNGPVSEPTQIGAHTWVAQGVSVLRGATIGANSIVAAGSTVRGPHPEASLLAGTPARVVRPAASWSREMPPD